MFPPSGLSPSGAPTEPLRVALLGCGVVGSQVARLLTHQQAALRARVGCDIDLVGIGVRDATKPRAGIDPALFTDDPMALITRGDVDIVIEVIGGIEPARTLLMAAIDAGASVVTANKALLAQDGPMLYTRAEQAGVDLYFEAAVAGAIPIVRPLRESLVGDEITAVMGIVNGTTNYILDAMCTRALSFADALAEAQALGYAEADPTADVEGYDAAAKAAILASLAFHTTIAGSDVAREGITAITQADIAAAQQVGCIIKLLAIARLTEDDLVSVRVHPAMVPLHHPLAAVNGAFNAIFIESREAGELMFLGPGAGGAPTASAVMGDLVTVARNRLRGVAAPAQSTYTARGVATAAEVASRYLLRFVVIDQPGVLASAAAIFAAHGISVQTVQQGPASAEDTIEPLAELSLMTHLARQDMVAACVADLEASEFIRGTARVLRVEGM